MAPAAEADAPEQARAADGGMRRAQRVVAARGEPPDDDARRVNGRLRGDEGEDGFELPVRAGGVARVGGGVAGAGDFEDEGGDAAVEEGALPDCEFGAVAVEAGEDDDERGGGGGGGEEEVGGDGGAFVGEAVGVRDEDLVDGVGEEGGAAVEDGFAGGPGVFLLGGARGGEARDAVDGRGAEVVLAGFFGVAGGFGLLGDVGELEGFGEEALGVFIPVVGGLEAFLGGCQCGVVRVSGGLRVPRRCCLPRAESP